MTVLWFLVGIPLAIELIAGLLGCRDLFRHTGLRARAVERLVVPTILLGVALWIVPPRHWSALAAALVFVLVWQVAVVLVGHWLVARPGFSAASIDTRDED